MEKLSGSLLQRGDLVEEEELWLMEAVLLVLQFGLLRIEDSDYSVFFLNFYNRTLYLSRCIWLTK